MPYLATTPKRYINFENFFGKNVFERIFETSKKFELRNATWSDYEYHSTVKFLLCVVPNLIATFISKAYPSRTKKAIIVVFFRYLSST